MVYAFCALSWACIYSGVKMKKSECQTGFFNLGRALAGIALVMAIL